MPQYRNYRNHPDIIRGVGLFLDELHFQLSCQKKREREREREKHNLQNSRLIQLHSLDLYSA